MSDNYEFMRSNESQNIDEYTPYTNKQFNFVNDTNSSVYTNNGLSLVQFDLSSIYNSQNFVDTNDMFLVIPLVTVAAFSTNSAQVALPATTAGTGSSYYPLCSIKSSYLNLVHQCDLNIDGKTIESTQPYQNVACNFRLMSEMSQGDLKSFGPTYGFSEVLDTPNSAVFNNAAVGAGPYRGNGFTNNLPLNPTVGSSSSGTQTSMAFVQNTGTINEATQRRLGRTLDLSPGSTAAGISFNNFHAITGTGVQGNVNNELRPYYTTSGNYMIWYDCAIIKLASIMDSFAEIGLCKRFNAVLRLWINTGALSVTVANPNTTNLQYTIVNTDTTFSNTCPLMVNHLPNTAANGGIPLTTTKILAGLFIGTNPSTSVGGSGVSLGTPQAGHALRSCRIYYSQIAIDIPKAVSYISENRSKTVRFRNMISNQYYSISNQFNQLVSSGVVNPLGILIVPFISATSNGIAGTATNIAQYISPFDSAPLTTAPISLTNIQCSIGGQNQLNDTLYYTFQNFIEQVSMAENLTSADWGINCGVFSQQWWETFRYYYINVSRSAIADKQTPRNVNISFTNNTQVSIDIMVFIIYADKFVIDVETGLVTR